MNKEKNLDLDAAMIFLSGVDLFINLEGEIIESMAERMDTIKYEAGEYLIHEGNPGEHMLLIKQGKVNVMLKDKEITLGKGVVLGEMSLLSGNPSKADVIAQTDTEAFVLERDDFQTLMSAHTELASVMTRLMKSRLSVEDGIHTLGKYKILNQLGEGGMSIVYNALDTELGREVAIKMLKYEIATSEDFKKRFRQEAKIIAHLKHPNILHVIETIEDYSTEFIVMEKLDGYDLNYYLKHQGVFSGEKTRNILYQVATALEHANSDLSGGIIHRDIKLSNIVLDERDHVKLMDFGISTTNENAGEHYEGTVLYMSPELLLQKPIDHRVDIYALGITAFAMLTGKTPFTASSIEGVITNHLEKEPARIEDLVPDIPAGLAEFIHRSLIKDPEKRISSWLEIESLLSPSKSSQFKLEASSEMDLAIIIKMKSDDVDKDELLREIRWTLDRHRADYELETTKREEQKLDFDLN
ncbi:MAG: protein kinase [Gammaproteobacteria bacterium]|nr:protein kinase [Gammaproteobacteria bacterium]